MGIAPRQKVSAPVCEDEPPKFYWGIPESDSGAGFTWFLDEAILAEGAAEDWCQLNPELCDWACCVSYFG